MNHVYKRQVHFADTDAAGVVHFSRLLCYVEEAEHDLLAKLNIPLLGDGGWPRVHIDCDYLAPLTVGDTVEIMISPVKVGHSSVKWEFTMTSLGGSVARGNVKTVRVNSEGKPVGVEESWRAALGC